MCFGVMICPTVMIAVESMIGMGGMGIDPFRDYRREFNGADRKWQNPGLAEMYAPPIDVMHAGTFEAAREAAVRQKRWLLVNIQAMKEFESHTLNRDIWKHS